jgi:hypothetical protein
MFVVTEAEAAAIRTAFDRGGELSAAVELRRLFPGVTDNAQARECARPRGGHIPLVGQAGRLQRSVAFLPPRRCGGRQAPAREAAGPPSPGTQHNRQWSGDDGQVPVSVRLPIPAMDDPWCCSSSWWVALDLTSPRASDHQGVVTFRSRSELCNRCRSRRSAIHSGASPSDVAAQ